MATFKTPGVFIEEISTLPASVAPVPTSIPGFVGYTKQAIYPDGSPVPSDTPVRITSLLEFEQIFGGAYVETFTATLNDPQNDPVITIDRTTPDDEQNFILYYQMQMFYANGGGTCYVVSAGGYTSSGIDSGDLGPSLNALEQIDEVTLLVVPEAVALTTPGDRKAVYDLMLLQCQKMEDRFAILDVIHTPSASIQTDADNFRNNDVGADNLKYGASYYPGLNTTIEYNYNLGENDPPNPPISVSTVTINDQRTSNPLNGLSLNDIASDGTTPDTSIYQGIISELALQRVLLYPSASMAGTYARVDDSRGVWKAPANVGLSLVVNPQLLINNEEQGNLNVDSVSGKSINAIRQFTGRGNLVWGARTLAGNDNEWRYNNVRRLFLFAEESIKKVIRMKLCLGLQR